MQKVSVIMPCYNDGAYIEESVTSVLGQTYSNIELIIINDGSTDETTNRILETHQWDNTTVLKSERLGPAGARNLGIQHATGDYILALDADDTIEPSYIEKAVHAIQQDATLGIVYCKASLIGAQKGSWDLPPYTIERMLIDNVIFVTALFRKVDWEAVGGFDETLTEGLEDYDFWLSLIEYGREVHQIQEPLFNYRKKQGSRTINFQADSGKFIATYHKIYDNHPKLYHQYQEVYAKQLRAAWAQQLLLNRRLQSSIGWVEKLTNIPTVKKCVKKFLLKNKE